MFWRSHLYSCETCFNLNAIRRETLPIPNNTANYATYAIMLKIEKNDESGMYIDMRLIITCESIRMRRKQNWKSSVMRLAHLDQTVTTVMTFRDASTTCLQINGFTLLFSNWRLRYHIRKASSPFWLPMVINESLYLVTYVCLC